VVILVDTSVWVSFIRHDGSAADTWMRRQIRRPDDIAVTQPIVMELLAGATGRAQRALDDTLARVQTISVWPDTDFRDAGMLAAALRADGRTVRGVVDCLIAAVALRAGVTLAHRDDDFAAIACIAPLAVRDLTG